MIELEAIQTMESIVFPKLKDKQILCQTHQRPTEGRFGIDKTVYSTLRSGSRLSGEKRAARANTSFVLFLQLCLLFASIKSLFVQMMEGWVVSSFLILVLAFPPAAQLNYKFCSFILLFFSIPFRSSLLHPWSSLSFSFSPSLQLQVSHSFHHLDDEYFFFHSQIKGSNEEEDKNNSCVWLEAWTKIGRKED